MSLDIKNLKKRIIYRSSHRGTKEMDILISEFVESLIDKLPEEELLYLDKFINFDDEKILNFINQDISKMNISDIEKKIISYILVFNNK